MAICRQCPTPNMFTQYTRFYLKLKFLWVSEWKKNIKRTSRRKTSPLHAIYIYISVLARKMHHRISKIGKWLWCENANIKIFTFSSAGAIESENKQPTYVPQSVDRLEWVNLFEYYTKITCATQQNTQFERTGQLNTNSKESKWRSEWDRKWTTEKYVWKWKYSRPQRMRVFFDWKMCETMAKNNWNQQNFNIIFRAGLLNNNRKKE